MNIASEMLIGQDFSKIQLHLFELDLLEPNTFIGDVIIFFLSLFFAVKTSKLQGNKPFFKYWTLFFIVFGFSFLGGGFGHLMYNYWGVPGKYFAWYTGIISSFIIEIAFISIFPNEKWRSRLRIISIVKMCLAFILSSYVFYNIDLTVDQSIGLIVPTVNSIIGLGLTVGGLGYYYQIKIDKAFRFFWISTLVIIPSAFFQALKINFAQWFDRNDASHIFLLLTLMLYYKALKAYSVNSKV